jgi:hypothetical protein
MAVRNDRSTVRWSTSGVHQRSGAQCASPSQKERVVAAVCWPRPSESMSTGWLQPVARAPVGEIDLGAHPIDKH